MLPGDVTQPKDKSSWTGLSLDLKSGLLDSKQKRNDEVEMEKALSCAKIKRPMSAREHAVKSGTNTIALNFSKIKGSNQNSGQAIRMQ